MRYAIPYIEDKEIRILGNRTSENALDSLAKYSAITRLPLVDALGLFGQETTLGAVPYENVVSTKGKTGKDEEEILSRNNALMNSNYFRGYGIIPAEYAVRDYRYNLEADPISRDVPPLQHAFEYYKSGKYNTGDKKHSSMVRSYGEAMMKDPSVKKWISTSKYAQEAIGKRKK